MGLAGMAFFIFLGGLLLTGKDRRNEAMEVAARSADLIDRIRSHPEEAEVLRNELHALQAAFRRKRRTAFF